MQKYNITRPISYGSAEFNPQILNYNILQKCETVSSELKKSKWQIQFENYKNKWTIVFQNMRKCGAVQIIMNNMYMRKKVGNHKDQILWYIHDVCYVNLRHLTLRNNKINNIQLLILIQFQKLTMLDISDNLISQIKLFDKLFNKKLRDIQLNYNPLRDVIAFTRSNTFCQCLQINTSQKEPIIYQDLRVLVRLKAVDIERIFLTSEKRIQQKRAMQMLKQRFRSLQIRD